MSRTEEVLRGPEQRKPNVLDVRDLVASAVDGFCEHFQIAGRASRSWLLSQIAEQAHEMKREMEGI